MVNYSLGKVGKTNNENKRLQQTIIFPLWQYISKDGIKVLAP
jgi:hypothetical protein